MFGYCGGATGAQRFWEHVEEQASEVPRPP